VCSQKYVRHLTLSCHPSIKITFFPAISRVQPRIEAKIEVQLFGGSKETIEVKARLKEESGLRFTETYESASVLGQTIDLPEALQYSRDLYVSYVDEDILVVRDGAGVPEILVRK
jgi:hypothetical protein